MESEFRIPCSSVITFQLLGERLCFPWEPNITRKAQVTQIGLHPNHPMLIPHGRLVRGPTCSSSLTGLKVSHSCMKLPSKSETCRGRWNRWNRWNPHDFLTIFSPLCISDVHFPQLWHRTNDVDAIWVEAGPVCSRSARTARMVKILRY